MSVADDDTGHRHHSPYEPSPARSAIPQEYPENHQTSSLINKPSISGTRRRSPPVSAVAARPNSSNHHPIHGEDKTEHPTPQYDDSHHSTTNSSSSHLSSQKDTTTATTMRALHVADAVKVPSPTPAVMPSLSGPPTPTHSNQPEAESPIKDRSPVLTPSNESTNSTAAAIEDTPQQSKTRPKVTTPASPPPSPPSAAGTAATATATVDSPLALLSATVRSNTATPVKGGSLASLLHSAHREVDVPESSSSNERRGEAHGTPLSPTSMSQGTHSRKDSAATMASASAGTELDVGGKGGGDAMDLDPAPVSRPGVARSASHTPTALGNSSKFPPGGAAAVATAAAAPYLPTQSPQPLPHYPASSMVGMPSSLGTQHRSQPSPSPPTPVPSSHPPALPYPPSGPSAAPSGAHHQRRHSFTRPHHAHTRSYSGRTSAMANPASSAPATQPILTPQPRPLSPTSQVRSFARSEVSPGSGAGEERSRERASAPGGLSYEEMQAQHAQLMSQYEDLRAQLQQARDAERHWMVLAREMSDAMRNGEDLLRGLVDTFASALSAYGGRGHGLEPVADRDHERERTRAGAGPGGSSQLSSSAAAMVGAQRDYMERDKTFTIAAPGSPYTSGPHGRPGSGYGPGQDVYSSRHAADSSSHLARAAAARPSHQGTHSNSLRRSRRPSSDDLTEHGGKRIKANNGSFIRTSPDAAERASHSAHQFVAHALGRTGAALGNGRDGTTGDFASYPTSHNRSSGVVEHGRESPFHRRAIGAGKEEEEDEFPSPRRTHGAPPSAGNGLHSSVSSLGRPNHAGRVAALLSATEDMDAIGSPDIDTTGHESLMEMVEEEDGDGPRRGLGGLRHDQRSAMRNGSRSSMNSQEIDEMIAEVADGEDRSRREGNGLVRPSTRPRYRPAGSHSDALGSEHPRSYTPSSQPTKFLPNSTSSAAAAGVHQGASNPRGFVFRHTDVADMEAQAQARSPEELGHRPSFSGPGSFTDTQTSPPGTSGNNPVTTQFLPPQSGPPQPKKIYHTKGTGQPIGSQHSSSMINPAPTMPVDAISQQPSSRPIGSSATNATATTAASTSPLTIDGVPKRTCKQCGLPGRYKDNKCVEKWGPGPQGPGTVCDRCRKKMKRVEKRATQDSAAMNAAMNAAAVAAAAAAAMNHHQYPIAPAPSGSFPQHSNQGSQRFEESQEYGISQATTEDGQSQAPLSRAGSQNAASSMLPGSQAHVVRRGSHAPDKSMQRDTTLPYPPPQQSSSSNNVRETMPPPTSFTINTTTSATTTTTALAATATTAAGTGYGSPRAPGRSNRREPSAETRDGEVDADGDAEMDELVDEEVAAAAEASTGGHHRRREPTAVKPEA